MDIEKLLNKLKLDSFVAFDFETTGLDSKKDKIIEFAAIKFNNGKPNDSFQTLVNPERSIPLEITRITGISDGMVSNAPIATEIASDIFKFIGNSPIVAHNLPFDKAFLNKLKFQHSSKEVKNIGFDTVPLAQAFFFFLPNHKLGTIGEFLGLDIQKTHRALQDTEILGHVFINLVYEASSYSIDVIDKISSISKGRYFNNKTLYESISSELKRSKNYSTGLVSSKINKSLPSPIFYNDGSNPNPLFSPEEFFSENGPLHKSFKIDSYEKRENQIRYTEFIRHTLSDGGIGIIEAGTGLGKTLSYLLSALERAFVEKNQAVILSCNTKTLQDQLFQHEIPKLASALDMTFSATIIKGHRNYICATRTNNVIERAQIYLSDYDVQSMIVIIIWIQWTKSGDFEECPGFLKRSTGKIKELIQNEPGFCTGNICNSNSGCFLGPLRNATQDADLVVVNHSLLFYELEEQKILPSLKYIILDEAHNVLNSAYNHHRTTLNNQIIKDQLSQFSNSSFLIDKNNKLIKFLSNNSPELMNVLQSFIKSNLDILDRSDKFFKKLIESSQNNYSKEIHFQQVYKINDIEEYFIMFKTELKALKDSIKFSLNKLKYIKSLIAEINNDYKDAEAFKKIDRTGNDLKEILSSLNTITDNHSKDWVYWETGSFIRDQFEITLNAVPIDIGSFLRSNLFDLPESIIATSATLSIDSNFDYFINRFGLKSYEKKPIICKEFSSPFFYPDQCNYYQWAGDIDPNDNNYPEFICHSIETIYSNMENRMLVLFTSQRLLGECYDLLNISELINNTSILAQVSNASRLSLIKQFRINKGGILLGTNSFWEGIDLPGDLLKVLVVTKIPLDVPTDPIIQSYNDKIKQAGGNPFLENSIPSAAIRLRQGFGRLIRSINDDGIFLNLDNRVITKRYGKIFESIIPTPMNKFSTINELNIKIKRQS